MMIRTATGSFSFINYGVGWDVGGTPTNGDTFVVNTGTAIMVGGRFPDSTVDLGRAFDTDYLPNPNLVMFGNTDLGTIDVTTQTPDRSGAHIAVIGHATIGAIVVHGSPSGTNLTGILAPGSRLTTHFEGQPRTGINLTGGTLDNEGDSVVGAATISSNIIGHGSFEVLGFFGGMHVEGRVGAGQSVKLDGLSALTVDHPADFHASVDISDLVPSGSINLLGIHGDAWTYNNSRLSITSGGKIVEQLRLTTGGQAFTVTDTSNGIIINPSFAAQQGSGLVMPATRLWAGGEHDFFSPNAWSPNGRPSHGDTLIIGPGTASAANTATVHHHTLQDITVLLDDGPGLFGSPFVPTLSLNDAAIGKSTLIENAIELSPALGASDTEQILIGGHVRNQGTIAENPGASIGNTLNIGLAADAKLINDPAGTISGTTISNLNIEGSCGSVLVNNGVISGHGTKMDIGVPVVGRGTFEMLPGANPGSHTPITSALEFHQSVGAGQTISLNDTTLVLDKPLSFLATIEDLSVSPPSAFATNSSILLPGEQATGLSFNNDVLTVSNGCETVAQLHFAAGLTAADFGLVNTKQGASIGIVAPTSAPAAAFDPPIDTPALVLDALRALTG